MLLAKVIVNRPTKQLNNSFTYAIPPALGEVPIGTRVIIPLGKHGKEEGIIVDYHTEEETFSFQIKPIVGVLEKTPWFTPEMLATADRLSQYYLCSRSEALSLFTIDKKHLKSYERPTEKWLCVEDAFEVEQIPPRRKKQRELGAHLCTVRSASVSMLRQEGFSDLVIKQLMAEPHVVVEERYIHTRTKFIAKEEETEIPLTSRQREAYEPIQKALAEQRQETFLLHGVTGSGKTQLYLKAAQACLKQDKIAVVLVPEIILTNQIVQRFVEAFGDEVVVFHSKLTISERYNNWERLRRKDSHIIIGARSAVFAPTDDIGLFILDEEHDPSYKQEDMLRYHARNVALWRANVQSCPVILGSATPSIVSYYRAQQGEYTLLELPERIHRQPLPKIQLVDMKEEMFYGNYSVFSSAMHQLLEKTLAAHKQMIILLNRRGYSTFVMCRECGQAVKCPHCDVAMVYHQPQSHLRCHYCEHHEPAPTICPHCGSRKIKFFGTGTQKVEEELRKHYPTARIARLDQDVVSRKGEGERILEGVKEGLYDILLGTQMVSKGHDFPNVSAVGILTADSVLHIPLYTAAERTFNLLTQTAGRAGRSGEQGEVVVQTYDPLHYAIQKSQTHDYKGFYEAEVQGRQALGYPPFGQMLHIMVQHERLADAQRLAEKVVTDLTNDSRIKESGAEIFGPYEEGIKKVRDLHRIAIMIRGQNLDICKQFIYDSWIFTQEGILLDVDPI